MKYSYTLFRDGNATLSGGDIPEGAIPSRGGGWSMAIDGPPDYLYHQLEAKLAELKKDERNYYKSADIFTNAPLALIQVMLEAKIHLLEELLGQELSKFPLQKDLESSK